MSALESDFFEHQQFPVYFDEDDKPMHIDHTRHQISKQTDLWTGQPRFKHLAEFAKFLFLIPHSNSYCESIFSTVRKIRTDGRHNIGEVLYKVMCKQKQHL